MKKLFWVCSLVVALFSVTAFNAGAIPITGALSFSGTSVVDNADYSLATAFISFSNVVVSGTGGTGSYAPVLANQAVTLNTFTFEPSFVPNNPLWNFLLGGNTYSFDATEAIVAFSDTDSLLLKGTGIAHITGFDDTPSTWVYSANKAGATASFSASNMANPVPEPATMLLLGVGLIALAGYGRKKLN